MKDGRVVRGWRNWPQSLAQNYVMDMDRKKPHGRAPGYQRVLLRCALNLAERFDPPLTIDKIVVFYPRRIREHVSRNLKRERLKKGTLIGYKDLTIAATPSLRSNCIAFLIEDVMSHKTPADAYHLHIEGRVRPMSPKPLYDGTEPGTDGKPIHE